MKLPSYIYPNILLVGIAYVDLDCLIQRNKEENK
jgi:hypothetical protein